MALALAFGLAVPAASAADNDGALVQAAHAAYFAALNKMFQGDAAPIAAVWSHANDVFYMGPTGQFERGWDAVYKDFQGEAAMKLGGKVEPADVKFIVGRDLAVVTDYDQGENTNAQGKVGHVKLRATSIYRKENGQWKMIGHQTDNLPYLAK